MSSEMQSLREENVALKKKIDVLERLVAQDADAYNQACDEMERFQKARAKAGKVVGTEGSLVDGLAWLYGHIDALEGAGESAIQRERERIKDGIMHLALVAATPDDPPEVDRACKAMALRLSLLVEGNEDLVFDLTPRAKACRDAFCNDEDVSPVAPRSRP